MESPETKDVSNEDIAEDLKVNEEDDAPTIEVKPDDPDRT